MHGTESGLLVMDDWRPGTTPIPDLLFVGENDPVLDGRAKLLDDVLQCYKRDRRMAGHP